MNLKLYLLVQIILVAFICLFATSAYVLYRADQQSIRQSQVMLKSLSQQLELQLLRIDSGLQNKKSFPDLSLWKDTQAVPGICIQFKSTIKRYNYSLCHATKWLKPNWPESFAQLYQFMFNPGLAVQSGKG